MRRNFITTATFAVISTGAWAQDAPSSERGPNYPTPQHGPAYPKTLPGQQTGAPPSAAGPPAPQTRDIPLRAQPAEPSYGSSRGQPAQPDR